MMLKCLPFIAIVLFLNSCNKAETTKIVEPIVENDQQILIKTYNDTLQFLSFAEQGDYWYSFMLDKKGDTLSFVVDNIIEKKNKDKMFFVKWQYDTIVEAGDKEIRYKVKRILEYKLSSLKPYKASPIITEEKILTDISNLELVKKYKVSDFMISEKPTDENPYYTIQAGNDQPSHFSTLFWFHVYVTPQYEIRYYDLANDEVISLAEWKKRDQERDQ